MTTVVDENVLIVANDLTRRSSGLDPICPGASDKCGLRCAEALMTLIDHGRIGLDAGSEVLEKYKQHCSFSGQPGVGDAFMRAVFERGYVESWAERVVVRDNTNFMLPDEFLDCGFDNDDHLWIAIAHNSEAVASVLNAVDSDYEIFSDQLDKLSLTVVELCK